MPAPLYGADDPRRCSGNSVSEVLESIKNNLGAFLALPPETKATYTHFPEYIDPRLRNYRSRYGAISND